MSGIFYTDLCRKAPHLPICRDAYKKGYEDATKALQIKGFIIDLEIGVEASARIGTVRKDLALSAEAEAKLGTVAQSASIETEVIAYKPETLLAVSYTHLTLPTN